MGEARGVISDILKASHTYGSVTLHVGTRTRVHQRYHVQ